LLLLGCKPAKWYHFFFLPFVSSGPLEVNWMEMRGQVTGPQTNIPVTIAWHWFKGRFPDALRVQVSSLTVWFGKITTVLLNVNGFLMSNIVGESGLD
jgi:hypothetical protein